jgi:hypothetical protein
MCLGSTTWCKNVSYYYLSKRQITFVFENVDDNRHFVFYLLFLSLTNERMRKGQVNIICEKKKKKKMTSISIYMNKMYAHNRNDKMSLYPTSKTDVSIQTMLSNSIDFIVVS